jgi:hypothetical protein
MNYSWLYIPLGSVDELGRAVALKTDQAKRLHGPCDIRPHAIREALDSFVRADSCVVGANGGAIVGTIAENNPGFKVEVGNNDTWSMVGKHVYNGLVIQLDRATIKSARLVDGPWSQHELRTIDKSVTDGAEFYENVRLQKNAALARMAICLDKIYNAPQLRKALTPASTAAPALPTLSDFDYDRERSLVLEQVNPIGAAFERFAKARAAIRPQIFRREGW